MIFYIKIFCIAAIINMNIVSMATINQEVALFLFREFQVSFGIGTERCECLFVLHSTNAQRMPSLLFNAGVIGPRQQSYPKPYALSPMP